MTVIVATLQNTLSVTMSGGGGGTLCVSRGDVGLFMIDAPPSVAYLKSARKDIVPAQISICLESVLCMWKLLALRGRQAAGW